MSTGLKRTFYPVKLFFPVIALVVVLALVYGSFFRNPNEVEANISLFYPTNCLGGWKNVDKIAGQPEVRDNNSELYSEDNSASIKNSSAPVFCGGFSGEIPEAAKHQKVTLNFSWYIGDEEDQEERPEAPKEQAQMEVISDTPTPPSEPSPDPSSEVTPEPEVLPQEPEPAPVEESTDDEPASEPTAFNIYKHFFTVAHAQEEVIAPEQSSDEELVIVEPVAEVISEPPVQETLETKEDVESNASEGAYFEIQYTLNGQDWHTLGYVSRIANDVQIEMPIDLFSTVEDLQKVQIALHTVERFDSVPKIYLDSLWLEVTYDDVDGGELAPPGSRPGDVIFSKTAYNDEVVVVVLRNVELMTLSNVLSEATGSSTTPSETTGSSIESSQATTTTASTTAQSLTQFVSTSTLAEIINSADVLMELWLYASTTDSWSRIADDSIISRNPQVKFESGSVFWVDKNNSGVWRYNPTSGGYDAISFSEGQTSKLQFRDEAGEMKELDFSSGTSSVLLNEIKTAKPVQP